MATIKEKAMCRLTDVPLNGCNKVTIVGAGHVGMACAVCILSKGISNEICLIDENVDKVNGEILDLQHGSKFLQNAKITGGTDFAITAYSRMYIITAGFPRTADESRLALLERNAPIIKGIIPEIVKISPRSIIIMVTNPVDCLSYYAWKLSGFPKHRVMGVGTIVDSSRFRYFIGKRLNVAPSSCDANVIGEHGDSCVPVWSAVSVSGVNLRDLNECIGITEDAEQWHEVHEEVINAAKNVIQTKGYTNWTCALCCAAVAEAILNNTGAVMPVSTAVKGMYGIDKEVFLSMPCSLNGNGITSLVKLNLTPFEAEMLLKSSNIVSETLSGLQM